MEREISSRRQNLYTISITRMPRGTKRLLNTGKSARRLVLTMQHSVVGSRDDMKRLKAAEPAARHQPQSRPTLIRMHTPAVACAVTAGLGRCRAVVFEAVSQAVLGIISTLALQGRSACANTTSIFWLSLYTCNVSDYMARPAGHGRCKTVCC
jgi:hypothetical protein